MPKKTGLTPRYDNAKLGVTAGDWEWAARSLLGSTMFANVQALTRKRAWQRGNGDDTGDQKTVDGVANEARRVP